MNENRAFYPAGSRTLSGPVRGLSRDAAQSPSAHYTWPSGNALRDSPQAM